MSIRAIARKLGVSATAVSLALKNSPRVSTALRTRVRRLAKREGFVPNARLAELMSEVRAASPATYRATLGAFSLYPSEAPWREPKRAYLKVILNGARARAEARGYRLEYFWLKQPGMTVARFCSVLESRGIEGVLCLGSLDAEETLPGELYRFALTTYGASVPSKAHRVASYFLHDARTLFNELEQRGYRRPALAIVANGDRRTDYAYSAAYLSAQERVFTTRRIPILREEGWDAKSFGAWFDAHEPDVIVLHQYAPYVAAVMEFLRRRNLVVPRDIGIALLDLNPNVTFFTGICQDNEAMGAAAAEMLIGRVLLRDFQEPQAPKIELVVGRWNEARTLRAGPERPRSASGAIGR